MKMGPFKHVVAIWPCRSGSYEQQPRLGQWRHTVKVWYFPWMLELYHGQGWGLCVLAHTSRAWRVFLFGWGGRGRDFGRWTKEQSWRTGRLCMWGVHGRIFVRFRSPICCLSLNTSLAPDLSLANFTGQKLTI
jgi:hypothetical protein